MKLQVFNEPNTFVNEKHIVFHVYVEETIAKLNI